MKGRRRAGERAVLKIAKRHLKFASGQPESWCQSSHLEQHGRCSTAQHSTAPGMQCPGDRGGPGGFRATRGWSTVAQGVTVTQGLCWDDCSMGGGLGFGWGRSWVGSYLSHEVLAVLREVARVEGFPTLNQLEGPLPAPQQLLDNTFACII